MLETKQLMVVVAIDFHGEQFSGCCQLFGTNILHNISFCTERKKKLPQVWNSLRMSKWWLNLRHGHNIMAMFMQPAPVSEKGGD